MKHPTARPGPSLLIVDDEPGMRDFIGEVASDLGYEVAQASDGDACIAAVESRAYDVLIIDLNMPGTDGVELMRRLGESHSDARVLLISGLDERTLTSARRLGTAHGLNVIGALHKPIMLAELEAHLKQSAASG